VLRVALLHARLTRLPHAGDREPGVAPMRRSWA
jgi:hypothetical protein